MADPEIAVACDKPDHPEITEITKNIPKLT